MKVAVLQICSKLDYKENLKTIYSIIQDAKEKEQIEYFYLPEVFYSMSDGLEPTPHLLQKDNEHYQNIQKIATDNQVYIIGGTAATIVEDKIYNRTYSFNPKGEEYPSYDKINLFSINSTKQVIDEATVYTKGSNIVDFDLDAKWRVGLSVCFDIRFSDHYRELYNRGVNIITASSAFTIPTGKAHWEVLLRARAIESQSYVVASGQVGDHNHRIKTYGHSMIIDPWGSVIANAKDSIGYISADLDIDLVNKVKSRIQMSSKKSIKI